MGIQSLKDVPCLAFYILVVSVSKAALVPMEMKFSPISPDADDFPTSQGLLKAAARNIIQSTSNTTDILKLQSSHWQHNLPFDNLHTLQGLEILVSPNKNSWTFRNNGWPILPPWGKLAWDTTWLANGVLQNTSGDIREQKKLSHFRSWGKRDIHNSFENAEKRWKEMSAWGKRDDIDNIKKWKEMSAWGKRDDIDNIKKWKEMSAWGKRDDIDNIKKWKEMSAWGKRDDIDNIKKWKEMSVWGKRDDIDNIKKWKEMSVWGKRDDIDIIKKWKEMKVWGKRDDIDNTKKWKELKVWGKRDIDSTKKWKELTVWGKRNGDINSNGIYMTVPRDKESEKKVEVFQCLGKTGRHG
ncbi:hypothetical protein BsWGS_19176 [Bradybaena similaris]